MNWVKQNNEAAEKRIGNPKENVMYDRLLKIFNSKEKIPQLKLVFIGEFGPA